mmetsp:Transcript_3241/g.9152  ORF Transcript_3241/g.9152 Transcript_3241/m.9152 type:complete len:343 (-) Transcript_3241:8-1036(-)
MVAVRVRARWSRRCDAVGSVAVVMGSVRCRGGASSGRTRIVGFLYLGLLSGCEGACRLLLHRCRREEVAQVQRHRAEEHERRPDGVVHQDHAHLPVEALPVVAHVAHGGLGALLLDLPQRLLHAPQLVREVRRPYLALLERGQHPLVLLLQDRVVLWFHLPLLPRGGGDGVPPLARELSQLEHLEGHRAFLEAEGHLRGPLETHCVEVPLATPMRSLPVAVLLHGALRLIEHILNLADAAHDLSAAGAAGLEPFRTARHLLQAAEESHCDFSFAANRARADSSTGVAEPCSCPGFPSGLHGIAALPVVPRSYDYQVHSVYQQHGALLSTGRVRGMGRMRSRS